MSYEWSPRVRATHSLAALTDASSVVLAATDLSATSGRRQYIIFQNQGTVTVYINLTGGTASKTGANGEYALAAGTGAADGKGGVLTVYGIDGAISAVSASGTPNLSITVAST